MNPTARNVYAPALVLLVVLILTLDGARKLTIWLSYPLIPYFRGHRGFVENIGPISNTIDELPT